MSTLFEITYRAAEALGIVVTGTATGGSTTTIIDTNDRDETDDAWNKGSAWILKDAGGVAPQGEFSVITDFANTSHTLTIRAVTAAVASGDEYAVAKRRYPLAVLKQKVNEALRSVGPIAITDTSLTTADEQTEYTLPLACQDLREVYLQIVNDDSDDNRWMKLHNWTVQKAATGSASTLILPQFESGYKLKLVYVGEHPRLYLASDKVDESLDADLVTYEAVVRALLWRKQKVGNSDPTLNEQLNFYQDKAEQTRIQHPVKRPSRTAKLLIVGG